MASLGASFFVSNSQSFCDFVSECRAAQQKARFLNVLAREFDVVARVFEFLYSGPILLGIAAHEAAAIES